MTTFKDILKKSFLEGFASTELGTKEILVALFIALLLGLYIFFCYRFLTRRTFYSKSFNISLVGMTLVTTAIILTIQTSVVVSLGMVGALSIVRFRTAIKDPMDLVFLYWAISVGIICGAGLSEIAVIDSLIMTVVVYLLDLIPVAKAPMILVVNADSDKLRDETLQAAVKKYSSGCKEKSRSISNGQKNVVIELRTDRGAALTKELSAMEGVTSVSLLSHDGEVTF